MIVLLVLVCAVIVVSLSVLATFVKPTGSPLARGRAAPAQPRARGPPARHHRVDAAPRRGRPPLQAVLTDDRPVPPTRLPPCPRPSRRRSCLTN